MERFEKTDNGLVICSEYFDVCATLECGQLFRFYRTEHGYTLISGDKKCCLVTEKNDTFKVTDVFEKNDGIRILPAKKPTDKNGKDFSLPAEKKRAFIITDAADYFYDYFDFNTDYAGIVTKLSQFGELKESLMVGRGIHILRQQLFETIISFIISANNNIPRIQGIIERLSARYGTKMDGYFAFPAPLQLRDADEDDYRSLGAGYRAQYLQKTVHKILETDILNILPTLNYANALKLLLSLKGIGPKVADCICLFALKHTECYPADVWIRRAEGGGSAQDARRKGMERYGVLAGYAQQYKFYSHIAEKNKR